MPVSKGQTWLDKNWFFRHTTVNLNNDTSLLKIIAMIAMVIDHLGAAVFPSYRILRIIGRIAFPIYAYCIAVGCVYTHNMGRYIHRLVLLALISQPIYVIALNHTNSLMYSVSFAQEPIKAAYTFYLYSWKDPSIMLTLAIGAAVIWSIKENKLGITAVILICVYLLKRYIDYGIDGIVLMILMYLFINVWYISLPIVAGYMLNWGMNGATYSLFGVSFGIQTFAMLALPLIYIPMKTGIKINKWVFYAFYPLHLGIIILIKNWDSVISIFSK